MTVADLIKELEQLPQDAVLWHPDVSLDDESGEFMFEFIGPDDDDGNVVFVETNHS